MYVSNVWRWVRGKHGVPEKLIKSTSVQLPGLYVTHFLAVSRMHGQIHMQIQAHIVIELACLARIQGLAMKSAWESSRGPEQDTETETEREKERGRLPSPDKIPLFICPTLSFPPPLHTSLPLPSTLPFLLLQEPGKTPSKPGQGNMSVTVKSPYRSNQALNVSAQNKLAVHE